MTKLAELQDRIQRSILTPSADVLDLLASPPRGRKDQRLQVYATGYLLRLAEFLANDYERLRVYLGEARFNAMANDYAAANPSDNPNARWYSRSLPEFLEKASAYRRHPEIAELARLERALNDAFDGPDSSIVTMTDLAAIPPESFNSVAFKLAPTVHRFAVSTNVTSLWSSLKCEECPPPAIDLDAPAELLVWRQGNGSRFRILGAEEAMAIDTMAEGVSFGTICEMMAAYDDPDSAAYRAASYLRGWIEAEIISAIVLTGQPDTP